jgi:hypothetical protein
MISAKRPLEVFEQKEAIHLLATTYKQLKGVMWPIHIGTTQKKEECGTGVPDPEG